MNRRDGMRILHHCVHRPNLSSLLLIAKYVAWSGELAVQILFRFWFAHFWFAKSNARRYCDEMFQHDNKLKVSWYFLIFAPFCHGTAALHFVCSKLPYPGPPSGLQDPIVDTISNFLDSRKYQRYSKCHWHSMVPNSDCQSLLNEFTWQNSPFQSALGMGRDTKMILSGSCHGVSHSWSMPLLLQSLIALQQLCYCRSIQSKYSTGSNHKGGRRVQYLDQFSKDTKNTILCRDSLIFNDAVKKDANEDF